MASPLQGINAAEVKQGQVDASLSRLGGAISELQANVANLISALAPVSRDEPNEEGERATKDKEALVPVASSIHEFRERINELNSCVMRARARLEL